MFLLIGQGKWLHDAIFTRLGAIARRGPGLFCFSGHRGQTQYFILNRHLTRLLSCSHTSMTTIFTLSTLFLLLFNIFLLLLISILLIDRCRFLDRVGIVEGTNFCRDTRTSASQLDFIALIATVGPDRTRFDAGAARDALSLILGSIRIRVLNLAQEKLCSLLDLLLLFL